MTAYNVIVLASVMLLTGSIGGLANYLLAQKDVPQGRSIWRSWLLGIVAALLVPLFFKLISIYICLRIKYFIQIYVCLFILFFFVFFFFFG